MNPPPRVPILVAGLPNESRMAIDVLALTNVNKEYMNK